MLIQILEDSSGQTPLHIAAKHASVEIIQFLLKFGANPSTQDHLGKPALSPKRILERALNPKLVSCSNHILDLPKAILLEHLQRLKSYVDHLLERPFTTYDSQEELLLEAIKNQVCDLSRLECPLNLPTEEILIWLEVYQYARMDPDQRSCDSTATCASSGLGHPLYYRPLSVASVTKPIDTYSLYAF
ncbi:MULTISPECIES: ankyrin repeat domain-containing protein [Candidatus Cardinium]|uniref:ankyrin repeat domain-containing protein n=1 Tax=Candidatus Cardinium TaxID=273135 RepID=UPI001FAAFC2D|nr:MULTISPECIES: ankyrin repeat domain-containing protein [Cardinium]